MFDMVSAMSHSPKLDSLKAADFGYFGATWWPRASYERLRIVTFLAAWVSILLRHLRDTSLKRLCLLAIRLGRWYASVRSSNLKTLKLIVWATACAEIDMEDGSLWDNLELAKLYRTDTREYVRYCLDLRSDPALEPVSTLGATVRAFETVGTAIRKAYNYG